MPRKTRSTQNLNPPVDATNADVIQAVTDLTEVTAEELDEINVYTKLTHKGHETHLWGQEVEEVE